MGIADGEVTSLALCWRLERSDGAGVALTSHDRELVVDGDPHTPAPGILPASISRNAGLEPHSTEVAGALSADALEAADLACGRWDGARAELIAVDWQRPDAEQVRLLGGELGGVSIRDRDFSAEMTGVAARLDAPACPATSPECRAQFGDKSCRVDLAGRTLVATVVSVAGGEFQLDRDIDDRFVLGRLRYMSGPNCGLSTVVLSAGGSVVTVRDLPRAPVEAGGRIELREGCDKRFSTCIEQFSNAANFRGEPHLPGNDLLTRYPGV